MSTVVKFVLTVDGATGSPVKVERLGEAGDLEELDLQAFSRALTGSAGALGGGRTVINIYAGGGPDLLGAPRMDVSSAAGIVDPMPRVIINPPTPTPPTPSPAAVTPPLAGRGPADKPKD